MTDAEKEALYQQQHNSQNVGQAATDAGNFFLKTVETLNVCPVCALMTMNMIINEYIINTNPIFAPKIIEALAQAASHILQRQVAFVILESDEITNLNLKDLIKPMKAH